MRIKAIFLFALLLGIALPVPTHCSAEQPEPRSVTLFFGDSVNGSIDPCPGCEGGSLLGGLARRGTLVQGARETRGGLLLVDSGDLFFDRYRNAIPAEQLTPMSEKARLILACYNLLGYDALGIGDDDLTLGRDFLLDLSRGAHFPFISSNLLDKQTKEALFRTHVILEKGGLTIGIFSLVSPYFLSNESDSTIRGITFQEPFDKARDIIAQIRSQADLVVLLSHLGFTADIELAETVPGIDVIVGGHSGRSLSYPMRIKDTLIVQLGSKGLHVGELGLQPATDKSSRFASSFRAAVPLSPSVEEHPEIAAMVRAYNMKYSPEWFRADRMCREP